MHKLFYKAALFFMMLIGVCSLEAQTPPTSAAANASVAQNTSTSVNTDSFGDIAALGEQIALAQRKIQAMELKNNLAALEAQQLEGHFDYKVVRVEGFGDTLYAILSDGAGILYQVGPGDFLGNQYRVTLIRPTSVGVIDVNTRQFLPIPFAFGDGTAGVAATEFSDNEAPGLIPSAKSSTTS